MNLTRPEIEKIPKALNWKNPKIGSSPWVIPGFGSELPTLHYLQCQNNDVSYLRHMFLTIKDQPVTASYFSKIPTSVSYKGVSYKLKLRVLWKTQQLFERNIVLCQHYQSFIVVQQLYRNHNLGKCILFKWRIWLDEYQM